MAINFDSFTEGTTSTIQTDDYVVGFDTAVPGGERKFRVSTIANAVSGIITPALVETPAFTGTFKNKIINGDMRIDQRRAGAVYTQPANTAGYGSCDRWFLYPIGSALSAQRVSGTLFNTQHALALSGATGNTQTQLFHRIESANCYDLAGQTITLSFNACSNTSLSTAYALTSLSGAADVWNNQTLATPINFAGGTFNLTTIPTKYSFTCVVPSSATNGIQIALFGNALNASQAIYLTNVQLEKGPTATPFEHRPIGTELALCQRYYEKSYNLNTAPGTAETVTSGFQGTIIMRLFGLSMDTASGGFVSIYFKVMKRSNPALTLYSARGTLGAFTDLNPLVDRTSLVAASIGQFGFQPAYQGGLIAISSPCFHFIADAEL